MEKQQPTDQKKKVSLGICFPNTNKASEKSYDLKGTVNINGKNTG